MIDNPLFDLWLQAVTPYYQREQEYYPSNHGLAMLMRFDQTSQETALAVSKAVDEAPPLPGKDEDLDALISPFKVRQELVTTHSWAVPNEAAVDKIVEHSPRGVVEIGAGGGYWARLLRARGVDVRAYDQAPYPAENSNVAASWSPVTSGGPEKAALWPQHTLFLCWPPYSTPMAFDCLCAYKGSTFIYVGESDGGCNGDEQFHAELEDHWQWLEDEYVGIPRWPGIHDGLSVYKRV